MGDIDVKQGEIYFVKLEGVGSEQQGYRPFLIASTDHINSKSGIVVGYPITHARKRNMPYHFVLKKKDFDFLLYDENIVLTECVTHLSVSRLQNKLGKVDKVTLNNIISRSIYVFMEMTK